MSGTGEDLSRAISILRISRGWSQEQLARAAGITSSALSEYERGKKIPELKSVRKLVSALGYSLSALERTEDFLRELHAESFLEARQEPEGGYTLVPVSFPPKDALRPRAYVPGLAGRPLSWGRPRSVSVFCSSTS